MIAKFPPMGLREDSSKFSITREDVTISSKTDGGYVYTRPRHARPPRRHITTGFTNLNQEQWFKLDQFIAVNGKHTIFSYVIPTTGEVIDVRLENIPTERYIGVGGVHIYDVSEVKLYEV